MPQQYDAIIVGSGHGGAQVAVALRQRSFAGTIAIIGEELHLPYDRPALSKEYLAGDKPFERLLIFPAKTWAARDITLLPGRRVISVDATAHTVTTAGGEAFGYGALIWAAGGQPRRLACNGADLPGVHSVRERADVDRITSELPAAGRIVVIGGGYVGLEAAAVLCKLGKQVIVLEAQDRVLARVAGEELSRFYEAQHRAHGVQIRLGAAVACIEGQDGRASGVRLATGEVIGADMVIVGIGIIPSVGPLRDAGAACGNGVAVDEHCRTGLPDIFAIGDCALHPNPFGGGTPIRLESVQNANDMAAAVAATLSGETRAYHAVPWFWSNQYDLRLQTIGLSAGHDQTVLRGDVGNRSFSVVYLKQNQVVALDCVNAVKDYVQGRSLVVSRAVVQPALLADSTTSLKDIAAFALDAR